MREAFAYGARVEYLKTKGITSLDAQVMAGLEKAKAEAGILYPPENRYENMPDAELHAANLTKATGVKHTAYRTAFPHAPFVVAPEVSK